MMSAESIESPSGMWNEGTEESLWVLWTTMVKKARILSKEKKLKAKLINIKAIYMDPSEI